MFLSFKINHECIINMGKFAHGFLYRALLKHTQ